jgi:2-phospho-L-lactate guanylyltransferase
VTNSRTEPKHWIVVVPFKGAPRAKSRLAERFDDSTRAALARAFLVDTVSAAAAVPSVTLIIVVSSETGVPELLAGVDAEILVVPDPGAGLNTAVASGIERARERDADAFVAAMTGDLPSLSSRDLESALDSAVDAAERGSPLARVADHGGDGTTTIMAGPGVAVIPHFGVGSSGAHEAAGHLLLDVPSTSSLRHDVDSPADLDAVRRDSLGAATLAVLKHSEDRQEA